MTNFLPKWPQNLDIFLNYASSAITNCIKWISLTYLSSKHTNTTNEKIKKEALKFYYKIYCKIATEQNFKFSKQLKVLAYYISDLPTLKGFALQTVIDKLNRCDIFSGSSSFHCSQSASRVRRFFQSDLRTSVRAIRFLGLGLELQHFDLVVSSNWNERDNKLPGETGRMVSSEKIWVKSKKTIADFIYTVPW